MDILTHAITGACTGAMFGYPLTGAVMATVPDMWLGFKRKLVPNGFYNAAHSVPHAIAVGVIMGFLHNWKVGLVGYLALMSHLALDLPTHGPVWGPPLLLPFSPARFYVQENEWEWFNDQWWTGLEVAAYWCSICLVLTVIFG